jgi:1,4-alpha-glucan branching enzyme
MPPRKSTTKKAVFVLPAPAASQVQIAGDFTGWQQSPVELKRLKDGTWKTTLTLEPGRYEYRFIVDGDWQDDPSCKVKAPNAFGSENCVIFVT